jgi:hypothetical protein
MSDDGASPHEVFTRWTQTAVALPPFTRRDSRDLLAILLRHSRDGPRVAQTARQDGGGCAAHVQVAPFGEGNTSRGPVGMPVNDAGDKEYRRGWRPGSAKVAPTDAA